MAFRYRFDKQCAESFDAAIKHNQPIDGVKTTDDLITLAAVCLSFASKVEARAELGLNPSARQIEAFEKISAEALLPIHAAVQLGRHLHQTTNYDAKFEKIVEVEVVPQQSFPFFAASTRLLSGTKVENTLDLETSLFFEATF